MTLTPTEIKHIIYQVEKRDGYYCGVRERYENRADRIIKKLEVELRYLKDIEGEMNDRERDSQA